MSLQKAETNVACMRLPCPLCDLICHLFPIQRRLRRYSLLFDVFHDPVQGRSIHTPAPRLLADRPRDQFTL